MTDINREDERRRAAQLVDKTREQYVGVPTKSIEELEERAPLVKSLRQGYGRLIKMIAEDIYSKDMRFIYELIQNADDNRYTRIYADGQEPFLSFTLYPGHIIIDSNEDGFTKSDFQAMCTIRDSTKKDKSSKKKQGYIGEKGVGFKSVFKVAKRVHIQSEPYSFAFEYSLGLDDNGLGMVTPIQEEYEDLPPNVQTRCTLTLLAQSDFEKRAEDLENIPDTLLLFLKTLRKLHITIRRPTGKSSEVTYSCDRDTTRKLDRIVKRQRIDHGEWTEEVNAFRIAKRTVTNLPHDPARADIHEADVVLAFPVDGEECPVIKQQHVYAYLPLRQVGFPVRLIVYRRVEYLSPVSQFLIQSDFVTQANREDIFNTARNRALLQGVAETFRDAVLTFCEHESLQYQWMRYLPPKTIFDEFWNHLRPEIVNLLSKEPILRSLSGGLHRPLQLCYIPPDFRDRNYDPLFPDLDNEKYLNGRYSWKDFRTLESLGTTLLKWGDVIDRVEADLDRPDSTMKAPTTNDDWHKRAAKLLSKPFEGKGPKSESVRLRLRALRLVPTGNNDWISGSEAVYFPTAGGASIPMDLGRNIVVCDAVADEVRRTFFSHLGVRECSPEQVVPWIRERYEASRDSITIEQSISHLQYLFWISPPGQDSLGWNIRLIGPHGLLLRPDEIYFLESADGYSPSELFAKIDDGTPGFSTNFLPSEYIMAMAEDALSHGRSWRTWLEKVLGVQSYPRFLDNGELSEDFRYILSHRPERVVGLLQRFWPLYEPNVHLVCEELRHCKVPSETDALVPLHELYIPLPILKALVDELQIDGPIFLRMPVRQLHDEDEGKWIFLKRIGVRFTDDLEIYLKALRLRPFNTANWNNPSTPESIFKIYKGIMRKCVTDEEVARVRYRNYPVIMEKIAEMRLGRTRMAQVHHQPQRSQWICGRQAPIQRDPETTRH
ncbi:hypothetical protein SLS56_004496 [Neofusicoccum ribis]|uniref:Uncharacterized protein n=1 Tax=Neofusicoccum ribis TaxID=45134 RepID=A0ABR3SX07_9PEZI